MRNLKKAEAERKRGSGNWRWEPGIMSGTANFTENPILFLGEG